MTKEKPSVSVVIPVYNESGNIDELYRRIHPILLVESTNYEIIFVDDGSTDDSLAKVKAIRTTDNSVKIISLSRNWGHQVALSAGLEASKNDIVITMDGDLQHPPELLLSMINEWRNGADIVNMVKSSDKERNIVKKICATIFYKVMSFSSNVELESHASDFRLISRKVVRAICSSRERSRFLRGLIKWSGFPSTSITYKVAERFSGKSKYSFMKLAQLALSGVVSFSTFPLRIAFYVGILSVICSIAYAGYAIYARIALNETPPGWTSIIIVVIFMGSVQLISIGILGEYLARIYEEVRGRPLYLIREQIGFEEKQ